MNKRIIKKPKLDKDQNLPSIPSVNGLLVNSKDELNYKRSRINETNSGKAIGYSVPNYPLVIGVV